MSKASSEVQSFLAAYETANAELDSVHMAAFYTDTFLFGGPAGVQCVKKEDFLKVLPRRKEFFRAQGLLSSRVASVESSALDSKYTLARVVWGMHFEVGAGEQAVLEAAASYMLANAAAGRLIALQIDHQDLSEALQMPRSR